MQPNNLLFALQGDGVMIDGDPNETFPGPSESTS